MSMLGKTVASAEFAIIARVCNVAAVIIGLLASGLLALGGVMVADIRADMKDVAIMARGLDKRAEVHEIRMGVLERRLDKMEVLAFPWNGGPSAPRGESSYPVPR